MEEMKKSLFKQKEGLSPWLWDFGTVGSKLYGHRVAFPAHIEEVVLGPNFLKALEKLDVELGELSLFF
jgi:hypothetical protein